MAKVRQRVLARSHVVLVAVVVCSEFEEHWVSECFVVAERKLDDSVAVAELDRVERVEEFDCVDFLDRVESELGHVVLDVVVVAHAAPELDHVVLGIVAVGHVEAELDHP